MPTSPGEPDPVRRGLQQRLESLSRAGVTHLPQPSIPADPRPADLPPAESAPDPDSDEHRPEQAPAAVASRPEAGGGSLLKPPAAGDSLSDEQHLGALASLCQEVAACTRCAELARRRTQTVFGVGDPAARLCFVGEAPGADEDRQGEPFVGAAGQLLTRIIQACGLRREDVYICNVLKCRPPGNRNPNPDEIDNCRGYLEAQFDHVRPEYICCLGAFAAQTILDTTQSVGRLRGRLHSWRDRRVMVTYHPSYLLRNPAAKRQVWDDMQFLMREMGIEIPQHKPQSG